jgi:PPP family 3-phenylpropionic acid transporter
MAEIGSGANVSLLTGPARVSFTVRLALFYGALFLVYGVHLPYLPLWLDNKGLSAQGIAAVIATPYFLRVLITPTVCILADHLRIHRRLIVGLTAAALGFALLLSTMQSFWPIFLSAVPFAILTSTVMPLAETIAVAGVRAGGIDYGRIRLWGSLTFVAVGSAAGWLIDHTGAGAVMGCLIGSAAATALLAWIIPERINGHAPAPAVVAGDPSRLFGGEARRLVATPVFIAFLVAVGAVQGAHGTFYTFGALHWREQGISTTWIGALWAIAIAGEVVLFAYSGAVVRRFGPVKLMIAAAAGAILRWSVMSLSPPLLLLIPLQTLHTLSYGCSHIAAMHFISHAVPEGAQGTAQAFYATVAAGLLMGAAMLLSGWLYAAVGGWAYLAPAALSGLGLAAALVVRARWTGGSLWEGRPS